VEDAMALVIDDGDPWWLSPNLWVVDQSSPGDPSPGVIAPLVGSTYLLKALVRNTGTSRVDSARVDFFWADPSIGITRANANAIGSAFVTVDAGSSAEALELVPWTPSFVNGGHICVVAAVISPGGTVTNALDAVTDPAVAQRNLDLVLAMKGRFAVAFTVCNTSAEGGTVKVDVQELKAESLKALGIEGRFEGLEGVEVLGFTRDRCPDRDDWREKEVDPVLELDPLACAGLTLVGDLRSDAAAFSIVGRLKDRTIGGISVLVLSKEERMP
jgi:hypothetical protein